jgi:ApaG protein
MPLNAGFDWGPSRGTRSLMIEATPSEATTEGIRVTVKPRYVDARSKPVENAYFFAYEVTIANEGSSPAKLVSRHWVITDGKGEERHVRGPGVVGNQPHLAPGEAFRYESFCPLETPEGAMRGSFQMARDDGSVFDAEVATFAFSAPRVLN